MLDKFKFLLFFILILVLAGLIYLVNYEKDMKSYYQKKDLHLSFEAKKKVSKKKLVFMERIIKAAQYSNYQIEQQRKELLKFNKAFSKSAYLSKFQRIKLVELCDEYGVEIEGQDMETSKWAEVLDELSIRVQIVPVRLAVAQAILESAWGTSRFAKEAHAYFGIHCYEEGCGMEFGSGDSKVYVKSYPDMWTSVEDYMHFLNSKNGTKNFRLARQAYFESSKKNIKVLAQGLDSYSEIGGDYHNILNDLFQNYIPDQIDNY